MKRNRLSNRLLLATLLVGGSLFAFEPNEWRNNQTLEVSVAGLVRVNLPDITLDAARAGLEDLRIVDPVGSQVPYLIDRPMPESESSIRPKDFRSTIQEGTMRIVLTTGTTAPLEGVTLETSAAQYVKGVDVEGSHDGKTWTPITSGQPIFQMPNGPGNMRVSFRQGAWEFLRLTITDRQSPLVPFTGARLHKARGTAPANPIAATIKSNEESLGATRLDVDLGAANLTLASLRLETNDPLFTRTVTIAVPEIGEDGIHELSLAHGTIYRINANGKSETRLDISVEQQIPTRNVIVLIRNEDSPPLSVEGVHAEVRPVRLIFLANQPGRYLLLSGNPQCAAPRYDLSSLGEQLQNASATQVVPSPLVQNPNYKPPEALATVTLTGSKIDISNWKFRKELPISDPGVQQVEFDPQLLAHTLSDQRDVRIVRGEHQLPFLFERTSIARQVFLNASPANDQNKPTFSRWSLKMPHAALPITRIVCASSAPLFHREMRLWEEVTDERGDKYPVELGRVTWNQTPSLIKREFVADLSARPQSDTLFLETDNGDNPPIELRDFRCYYEATRLIFKAAPDSREPLWIYYGNGDATAPRYDLSLASAELLRAGRINVVAGTEENLSGKTERVGETLTGSIRYIFWGALAFVVIALLVIMSRFLPKPTA